MKVKLKEICTQIRGVSYKPTDIRDSLTGIPILRANNIQDDGINLDELVYVDSDRICKAQYIQKDDIVICASSGSKNLVVYCLSATWTKTTKLIRCIIHNGGHALWQKESVTARKKNQQ